MIVYLKEGENGFEGLPGVNTVRVDPWIDLYEGSATRTDINFQATWTDASGHSAQCIVDFIEPFP